MRGGAPVISFEPHVEPWRAAVRGTVAAMAMTGARKMAVELGLIEEGPPDAIARQAAPRLLANLPAERRAAAVELAHWTYGAMGGVIFAALPERLRRHHWAGPAYGLAAWAAFETVVAPALGLEQSRKPRVVERLVFAADHLLYGIVVGEVRIRRS